MMAAQDFEHAVERRLEVGRGQQCLTGLQQRGQLADFAGVSVRVVPDRPLPVTRFGVLTLSRPARSA